MKKADSTEQKNALQNLQDFIDNGFSILPFKYKGKFPMIKWKENQGTKMSLDDFKKHVGKKTFNIGIATGKVSGIVVVDVDVGANLEELELPDTVSVETGGGGYHFYYKYPKGVESVKSNASFVADHVDIRGDGGCIVAPPSTHKSGKKYKWIEGKGLGEIEMAKLPRWVIEKSVKNNKIEAETLSDMNEKKNTEGDRNNRTISFAGKFVTKNNSIDGLEEAVRNYDENNNIPSLPQKEIKQILSYVVKNFKKTTGTKKATKKEKEKKEVIIISENSFDHKIETVVILGKPKMWDYDVDENKIEILDEFEDKKHKYIPIPSRNSMFTSGALLFPTSYNGELLTKDKLVKKIGIFIKKYVDCSNDFLVISSYYVLFSYFYRNYEVLPYLRVIGDYGSGKSQLLQTVGSLCYNPMIMNGSASLATVFRVISMVKGTLIFDEADLPESDTTNDFIKILNNGYRKGMNVFRSDGDDFSPRAFEVFGPKIIGGRMEFRDKATESRCITEIMQPTQRQDIGKIDGDFHRNAEDIRNLCFSFWFHNMKEKFDHSYDLTGLEPRQKQIIEPLLSVIDNPSHAKIIIQKVQKIQHGLSEDRKFSLEGAVFYELKNKIENTDINKMYLKDIKYGIDQNDDLSFRYLSSRQIGSLIRQHGCISSRDGTGTYIPFQENIKKLESIFKRYNL